MTPEIIQEGILALQKQGKKITLQNLFNDKLVPELLRTALASMQRCTSGVLGSDGQVISTIDRSDVSGLIEQGVLTGGMLPKMKCAIDAVSNGVRKVHIVDGRVQHAMLLELFTDLGVGTEVV